MFGEDRYVWEYQIPGKSYDKTISVVRQVFEVILLIGAMITPLMIWMTISSAKTKIKLPVTLSQIARKPYFQFDGIHYLYKILLRIQNANSNNNKPVWGQNHFE
jgi:hypothetical protein